MDAVEILGAILGKKSGSGGAGGAILKDILGGALGGGGGRSAPAPQQRAPQSRPSPGGFGQSGQSAGRGGGGGQGGDLQDMINDAYKRFQGRGGGGSRGGSAAPRSQPQRQPAPQPRRDSRSAPSGGGYGHASSELDNERAVILIRAMINAAKADGQLDQSEQEAIVKQLGDVTEEEVQFLRREFQTPLNVRAYVWSVPLGLEEQVYGLSLMAIDLDENKEAQYLKDLAHGLRLSPDTTSGIHRQLGAPVLR